MEAPAFASHHHCKFCRSLSVDCVCIHTLTWQLPPFFRFYLPPGSNTTRHRMNIPPIIILCDGTWCGRETGTQTNIYRLAELFGINFSSSDVTDAQVTTPGPPVQPNVHARYRHGVGVGSTFLDYLFNGVTAQSLGDEVRSAYRFIVDRYQPGSEIWLFGLSRGAYTVRCVAGMINNCGILRRGTHTDQDLKNLCCEAYQMYRSKHESNLPHSRQSADFRRRYSWPLIGDELPRQQHFQPPVRFMGLFDTVGSLGIPTFTGGVGLEWPEFHNNEVSSVVQEVYHLVSVHDRFYIFQPCLATRANSHGPVIDEEWIPGVHYDLGRQRFRFWRDGGSWVDTVGTVLSKIPFIGGGQHLEPNNVLSDFALWKMLRRIQLGYSGNDLILTNRLQAEIVALQGSIQTGAGGAVGDGDVYSQIEQYGPFGSILGKVIKGIAGGLGLWRLFFDQRQRFIPDDNANVYNFEIGDVSFQGQSVADLAEITDVRYPARAAQAWALRQRL